jgi:pullulanase
VSACAEISKAKSKEKAQFDVVRERIPYLEALGVNAVEFMPWMPWPGGGFSWGYDPFQFFAVEYRYCHDPKRPLEKLHKLRELINALHDKGIHVVMDGVFNQVRAGTNPIWSEIKHFEKSKKCGCG